jgi:glycosyltransferase involved in cell wall biosynthesis
MDSDSKDEPRRGCWSVLHLINVFDARYQRDQRQIVDLQRRRGYDVTVVTSRYDDESNRRDVRFFQDAEKFLDGVKIFHTHSCKIPLGTSQPAVIYRPNSAVFKPYDITHIHGLTSYSCVLGCLSKRVNRTRLVTRADLSQEGYALLKNNAAWRSVFFKLLKSIDAVYAYTDLEKAVLVDVGIPDDDIWVVPLGVRLEQFCEPASREDAGHTLTIGYVGRFDWVKGVHRLVAPLSKILRKYEFVRVIFAGPKRDVRYANNVLSRMRALPNFSYLGRPAETPPFYRRCDIIVIPSLYDTGTIVALEAMASGKAIIASNVRPLSEYLEHGVSALLVETEEEIYSSCKRLIEDPDLRAKLGAAARKESSKYSDLAMIRKLEQVYACVSER